MVLETERLRLTAWEASDSISFRAIASDPDVMRYITDGKPLPDEQAQEFVRRQIENFATRGFCMWKLLDRSRADTRIIGFCGLQPLIVEGQSEVEVGWWLAKDCWGKGLATEAARTAMGDGFRRVRLRRVVAIARPDNLASLRVMQKLGMTYERDLIYKGVPVVLYSIHAAHFIE